MYNVDFVVSAQRQMVDILPGCWTNVGTQVFLHFYYSFLIICIIASHGACLLEPVVIFQFVQ